MRCLRLFFYFSLLPLTDAVQQRPHTKLAVHECVSHAKCCNVQLLCHTRGQSRIRREQHDKGAARRVRGQWADTVVYFRWIVHRHAVRRQPVASHAVCHVERLQDACAARCRVPQSEYGHKKSPLLIVNAVVVPPEMRGVVVVIEFAINVKPLGRRHRHVHKIRDTGGFLYSRQYQRVIIVDFAEECGIALAELVALDMFVM